jgi:hypothetical protein
MHGHAQVSDSDMYSLGTRRGINMPTNCKKTLAVFRSLEGMSLPKLSLAGNN